MRNREDNVAGHGQMRLFWCHPCLMDYRKPLFDRVQAKYRVKFFFERRGQIDHQYDAVYGRKKFCGRMMSPYDVAQLYSGIKDCDVFISSFLFAGHSVVGTILAKMLGKKIVVWEELSCFFGGVRPTIRRWATILMTRYVDAFFVLGEPQRRALCGLGVHHTRIFIANECPGHDYSEIEASRIESLEVDGREVILYLGRFIPVKGVDYLLQAYRLLEKKHSRALLLLVGYGPLKDELGKQAEDLGIRNIRFLDAVTDVHQKKYLFEISRMLVVPSVIQRGRGIEGGPLVVLEALSAGTPVLGTDGLVSSAQFISNGVNGFIVPHSDAQALYEKMEEILSWGNPQEARKRVQTEFGKVKGFDYQFDVMDRAIGYCISPACCGHHPAGVFP